MNRGARREGGFSLIELAMIMTIISLVVAAVLQQYRFYISNKQYGTTETNIVAVATSLSNHLFNFGDLPCPASPKRAPGDQRAGKAGGNGDPSSNNAGVHASCAQWVAAHGASVAAGSPYCENNTSDDHYGICIVLGERTDPTYGAANNIAAKDLVLTGSIPFVDLGLTIKQSMDGWGNRLFYAVSYYETQQAIVQAYNREMLGSINIQTFDRTTEMTPGDPTAWNRGSWNATNVPNSYMYVAFSFGADGKGAYDYNGIQVAPCTGAGWDVENCNGDATFRISGATVKDSVFSLAPGPDFFDDVNMIYDVSLERDKWTYTSQTAMQNKNGGSVAIGSSTINQKRPQAVLPQKSYNVKYKMDVAGDLVVKSLDADYICDGNGANCFKESMLSNSQCTNGQLLTGFANGQIVCMNAISSERIIGSPDCPSNQYMTGFYCNAGKGKCNGKGNANKASLLCQP